MIQPKVSIVIPVYKTEKYLAGSVLSAVNQTYKDIEIILIDDGSPDKCPEICDALAKQHPGLRVIHKINGGLSSARNAGIDVMQGEFVVFLDSDDQLIPEAVEKMVEIAVREQPDAVIPNSYYKVYENGTSENVLSLHFQKEDFDADAKLFALKVIIGQGRAKRASAVLYRSSIIKDNRLTFPENTISEDVFFNLDYMMYAERLAMTDLPTLLNLKRNGSISSTYYRNFHSTILRIDDKAADFIRDIDAERYHDDIDGVRESLLFRNVLIYVIQIMVDPQRNYRERKIEALTYLKDEKTLAALSSNIQTPYFNGRLRRYYMQLSLWLWGHRCYSALCRLCYWAGRKNEI